MQGDEQQEAEGAAVAEEQSPSAENGDSQHAVASLERALAEEKDKHLRLLAEFENFRRRTLKEQSELLKYQGEKLVLDLLEVLDNLELALGYSSADPDKVKEGLEMIHRLFVERLAKWEIRGETGTGQQFDPQKHSAISRVPASETVPPGTVAAELKKAYFYKDKLIRPGEVVVAAEG